MSKFGIRKTFKLLREYTVREKVNFSWPFRPSGDAFVETTKFEVLPQKYNVLETVGELYDSEFVKETEIAEINIRFEVNIEDMTKVDIIATATVN